MDYLYIALKLIVGFSLINVWLIQNKKPTKWRGGNAQTLVEEFKVYGLGDTMLYIIGFLKVGFSVVLLASIYWQSYGYYAALVLATLLTGSIIMHFKIKDPLFKSFPAALFLVMCLVIAFV
ncbi:MAG: DoxX family protein [Winogradskyella sp.]|uniref:DoxX family protein n=1 Tax=Winogradskyella sp. TaxID=1883156 RepID=UPI0038586796